MINFGCWYQQCAVGRYGTTRGLGQEQSITTGANVIVYMLRGCAIPSTGRMGWARAIYAYPGVPSPCSACTINSGMQPSAD